MLEYCRLYTHQTHTPQALVEQLVRLGYERVDAVATGGELALRGGVLDVFPATFESPVRIAFDHSRILSIRSYNPKTLETLDRHMMLVILPRTIRTRPSAELPFEAFVDLQEGDLVVHLQHGIGRYRGRRAMPQTAVHPRYRQHAAGGPGEALKGAEVLVLEYAGGDRLYVPLDQLHLVQKYATFGGRAPALHKLGGTAWDRAKEKAVVNAWAYAKTLLETQARRLALPGHAFPADHEWQAAFEQAFPFRETVDQTRATAEVKRDLEAARPMDRLLLGDVGYGKTEVAIRAAFKAVMGQKQVAILVPTTILAYQHHRTLTKRAGGFPVRVDMLTRFQSEAEQRDTLAALLQGQCDIVIGTHRLLSGDVRFKDLGLLIIDEEQRFGVQDKEQLKHWRSQLDVLTLSATPIPRTLYLSLAGARDMSLVMTPPENRHPVETQVVDEEAASVQRWVRRELARDGQVYIVHNRVRSIHRVAEEIGRLVPEARLGVAHGQMREDELEHVMLAFMGGQLNVLVTTTIIESGIDIPNVNTLIVRQAEHFGLAELYQLRGRVGRFDRKAYAYLMISKGAVLSPESRQRLDAMMAHTALGSGFNIAMEDLKLRGAGNLLGVEQSGQISAVGFDLYCRLLRDAVGRLRQGEESPAGELRQLAHLSASA
jgi:transcription-repair coupling factor (superfamily II helicase)